MTTVQVLSQDSIEALKRDHERLRYEVTQLRTMLRAFMSSTQDGGLATHCRFTLNAALTTSDVSKTATVTEFRNGRAHASTTITVYNHQIHGSGVYMYEGGNGDAGQAYWDKTHKKWWICDMECP